MKKMVVIMLLGIILIGTGAKSKLDAQFPYHLDIEAGSKAAVQEMAVSSKEETLDELADDMGERFAWSEEKQIPVHRSCRWVAQRALIFRGGILLLNFRSVSCRMEKCVWKMRP